MIPYDLFARFYDRLMGDVDYAARAAYMIRLLERHMESKPEIVLDLACGTGSISIPLADAGFEVIGVDRSPQMLSEASRKAGSTNGKVLFLCQDVRELDLYGTVDAAVCCLDGINHLTAPGSAQKVFERVSLFLSPGGVFAFDLNSPYKFAQVLGNNTFVYDEKDVYCIWQNSFHEKSKVCDFDLTFFARAGGSYTRSDEHFAERAYGTRAIRTMLEKAGLSLAGVYDDLSLNPPEETSERILYVARKEC